jgi:hypothetical protein
MCCTLQEFRECTSQLGVIGNFAFPYDEDSPARRLQLAYVRGIPAFIQRQLRLPEIEPRLWHPRQGAVIVPVPEAPVNKNDSAPAGEDKVRPSRQIPLVQSIPIAHAMHHAPHG